MKEGFEMSDKGYKLMKEFGELVPGMVFKSNVGTNLVVRDILNSNVISVYTDNAKDPKPANWLARFEPKVKLIYDPREVVKKSVSMCEQNNEHGNDYKLLKEFGELVLGMVFKINNGKEFTIVEIFSSTIFTVM